MYMHEVSTDVIAHSFCVSLNTAGSSVAINIFLPTVPLNLCGSLSNQSTTCRVIIILTIIVILHKIKGVVT